jgi:hypothetical protein
MIMWSLLGMLFSALLIAISSFSLGYISGVIIQAEDPQYIRTLYQKKYADKVLKNWKGR